MPTPPLFSTIVSEESQLLDHHDSLMIENMLIKRGVLGFTELLASWNKSHSKIPLGAMSMTVENDRDQPVLFASLFSNEISIFRLLLGDLLSKQYP